jgi:hypothetical protein
MENSKIQIDHYESSDGHQIIEGKPAVDSSQADWVLGLNVDVVDFLSGYAVEGVLQSFIPGEVTVLVREQMTEHRSVTVQFDSFVFEGETLFCRPKDNGYEAHITIDDVEKSGLRRVPRFPVRMAAHLFPQKSGPVPITIVDISREGLGLELPMAVEIGQPLAIGTGPVFVFATVRHCRSVSPGLFRAGVDIQHVLEKPLDRPTRESSMLGRVFGGRLKS